jgi:hypothetical protein
MRAERGAGDSFEVSIGGSVQEGGQVGVGKNIRQNYQQADERSVARKHNLPEQTGVFVSYRRKDDPGFAGRLYDRLVDKFGRQRVFMDVSTIKLGSDFAEAINNSLSRCNVLIAVIGKQWLGMTDERGIARLNNPNDYVRVEIETALRRGIRVIPVLVENAAVPGSDELPESMAPLARRHGIAISHANFASDVERLIATIDGLMKSQQ